MTPQCRCPQQLGLEQGPAQKMDGQAEPWWPLVLEIAIGIVIYEVLKWLLRCLLQKAGNMISGLPAPLTPSADALLKNQFPIFGWWLRPPSSAESWALVASLRLEGPQDLISSSMASVFLWSTLAVRQALSLKIVIWGSFE